MFTAFLQEMKDAVLAWQPQDSREVAAQTCKTVTRQFHRNILATRNDNRAVLQMSYDVCEFIVRFVVNFQTLSFPSVLTYVFDAQKNRLMEYVLSIHNICCFECSEL